MLYVLHGQDFKAMREKQHSLIDALHEKRADAEVFVMDDENFSTSQLQEFIGGQGLFENKYIVTLDRCFLNEDAKSEIMDRIEEIAESPHAFLLVESEFKKKDRKTLIKYAQKVWEFEREEEQEDEYKIFSLTDAFGKRDTKEVWVEYQRAKNAGEAPEAIHGMLFWQVKSMMLAQSTKSANEASMSSYPYKKATQFSANFSEDELKKMSRELTTLYHEARRGVYELESAIEEFLLSF